MKILHFIMHLIVIINVTRDSINFILYECIVCRQKNDELDNSRGCDTNCHQPSPLIVFEFLSCSPSFSDYFILCG
uniref:Secreted protein n=1 Tax=Oryza glaberrima TaxID=4538 RepID=I1PCI4_ORYGL